MIREGTGYELYPLQSGGNDAPSTTPGSPTNWDLSAIPIVVGGGGQMAYYLLALFVTFYGAVVQSGGTGGNITPDALTQALVSSVELRNAWHGTPLQQQYALGAYLPIIEYLGCGFRLPRREMNYIPGANGTYAFKRTIAIPLCIGNVKKPYQTAQLALMYKKSQFVINNNAAAAIATFSTGATITNTAGTAGTNPTVRCSAILDPHPNLLLAPGVDWIDYQSPASANQTQVLLNSFGNVTGLTGTDPNGGVVDLLAITNGVGSPQGAGFLPGSFDAGVVARVEFPWRSQVSTQHPEAMEAAQILSMGGNGRQVQNGAGAANQPIDDQGYPYTNRLASVQTANPLTGLYGFPLVTSTEDLQLSKVQTAAQNEYYTLALTTGSSFSGTNHTLARHARSWSTPKQQDWLNQVVAAGLAGAILGTNNVTMRQKPHSLQAEVPTKQLQFVPWYMVKAANPKKV